MEYLRLDNEEMFLCNLIQIDCIIYNKITNSTGFKSFRKTKMFLCTTLSPTSSQLIMSLCQVNLQQNYLEIKI